MARKIKLTDARIGKLKGGDVEYMVWDTRIAGFGVRVRPSGHKTYVEAAAERIGGVMAGIMDKSPARSEDAP